jgi:hypothetical protein
MKEGAVKRKFPFFAHKACGPGTILVMLSGAATSPIFHFVSFSAPHRFFLLANNASTHQDTMIRYI